jgi:TPR repeat protein
MYEHGCGVARDDAQAVAWYRKAAEQGDADARAALERLTRPKGFWASLFS